MKNILIIKCGSTHDSIKDNFGDFEDWIVNQSNLPKSVFKIFNVSEGDLLRHPSEYIAAIITGSHANVNQRLPWLKYLKDWIVTARYSNIPVMGICFGHQIIAEALGGKVMANSKGQCIGAKTIQLTKAGKGHPIFKNIGSSYEGFSLHSFYVSELPIGAEELATNEEGINYSFSLDKIFGVQSHPEFTTEIMNEYVKMQKKIDAAKIRLKLKSSFKNQSIISNFLDSSLKL
ncbi:MAG: gamma-glutamyl-gamma-aminobutyrate hydrolase family protein [Prolixibacteraceae bacterium]|jgi:GMP synthase (glutamine-hydrolysing)|nr:gamma-glutamyl-gamma-aminobutyrate hydrolase family protein [Prolixibacteraceae bacterium]